MFEDYEKRKRSQVSFTRSMLDYGMGIIILLIGVFFFFRDKFDLDINRGLPPDSTDKVMGVVSMIYGSWRIYRGYQKKYFK